MPQATVSYNGGRPIDYNTTVAVAGTANVHDVYTDLGDHYGTGGYIINDDSAKDLYVYISNDGTTYSLGAYTAASSLPTGAIAYAVLKAKEGYTFGGGLQVKKLKIDASASGCAYRVHIY